MSRNSRRLFLNPNQIQIVHVWNRCVRRAYLCGLDPLTGRDFDHRRQWARDRLEHLASVFAIDCITFSIMGNHTHQVLRSRPDIVRQWDNKTVAERWLQITPGRDRHGNRVSKTSQRELNMILNDQKRLAELRVRLSDVSWWMRYFSQHMAVRANREDGVTGHFWESRFGSEVISDEASILACMVYVDLNPVRAQLANSPEESDYTGAKERIDDLRVQLGTVENGRLSLTLTSSEYSIHDWERLDNEHSGWLCPIEINEAADSTGPDLEPSGRRASRKGVFAISLAHYLELLDWTGRTLRSDKRGSIPTDLPPILSRLGINSKSFFDSMLNFGRPTFHRASKPPPTLETAI